MRILKKKRELTSPRGSQTVWLTHKGLASRDEGEDFRGTKGEVFTAICHGESSCSTIARELNTAVKDIQEAVLKLGQRGLVAWDAEAYG